MTNAPRAVRRGSAIIGLAVLLVACSAPGSTSSSSSSDSAGASGSGLPATIKIMSINGLTGPVSFAGLNAQKGNDLAVEQIKADGLLGTSSIQIDSKDAAASTQDAASFASQAIADSSYVAILGPSASASSLAVSPIVQQAGMPTVYVQSGSDGVLLGNYTYRVTPPATSYYDRIGDYVKQAGVKKAAVLFNSGNPTLVQLGQTTVPGLASKEGFSIDSSTGVDVTAQDFTTPASQIAAAAPDAAFLELTGPQYPVAITQLRQAGFKGEIIGFSAMGAGNLASAGQQAAGAVWPTNFTATQTDASSQKFVAAYQAKYGELPNNYAAEANSVDRAAIQKGLAAVAKKGFDGAQGALTFDGNDARVPGVLVRWDGSKEVLVQGAGS